MITVDKTINQKAKKIKIIKKIVKITDKKK